MDYLLNKDHLKTLDEVRFVLARARPLARARTPATRALRRPPPAAQVLTYHVHAGAVLANQLTNGEQISTLDGSQILTVAINGAVVKINAATVVRADLKCS